MKPLPIDALIPEVVEALRTEGRLVLVAPPGSGKTTRVPPALVHNEGFGRGRVEVLEPRRLAARMAARRVAQERGEAPGETYGYQVRHDSARCARTRLLYQTEGIFVRKLLRDPRLDEVGVLVLDEFHERHLLGDLALAAALKLRREERPELRLLVMSATLEADAIAAHLDDAPVLRAGGRLFPVQISFQSRPDQRPLEAQVAAAVSRLHSDGMEGDTLVFLPGAAEIRRAREACAPLAERADLSVALLHGDLPLAEQDRALAPEQRRKVILSTNVAESSVTVPGVHAVVDSGLARIPSHSPWTGLSSLSVRPISRASAEQRAGRAGRLRPGRCLRLYSEAELHARPPHDRPEIQRLDLAELALVTTRLYGTDGASALPWLDAPDAAALDAARALLRSLGAIEPDGALSATGEAMLRFPVHPRVGRLLLEGARRGVYQEACSAAALLLERDIEVGGRALARRAGAGEQARDLGELLDRFEQARARRDDRRRLRERGLEPGAIRAADRAATQLAGLKPVDAAPRASAPGREEALGLAALAAFPDRLARRRPKGDTMLLAAGGEAQLGELGLGAVDLALIIDARADPRAARGRALTQLYLPVEADWLIELFPEAVEEQDEVVWNAARARVERYSRLRFGQVVLAENQRSPRGLPAAAQLLAEQARRLGVRALVDAERWQQLEARLRLCVELEPEMGFPSADESALERLLEEQCADRVSLDELRELDLLAVLQGRLAPALQRQLARLCPLQVTLPGRRRAPVRYPIDAPPFVASFIQDFFGLETTPTIGAGRVPLQLQLLAPSRRPVQVTQDLPGFWDRHYSTVRRELCRRYPKHRWPEDPRRPTAPRRSR